ncbi:hypothetical protein BH23GEM7_BH23GEM7_05040 [soil metagenome]
MVHHGSESADALTWEMVDALEEVLDHWEVTHSPLDNAGLQKYMLARRRLNPLRSELPPQEA